MKLTCHVMYSSSCLSVWCSVVRVVDNVGDQCPSVINSVWVPECWVCVWNVMCRWCVLCSLFMSNDAASRGGM